MFKLVVLSCAFLLTAAKPSGIAPFGFAGHGLIAPFAAPLVAPLAHAAPLALAAPVGAYNYRGPVSLAPGQPASILAADGRPFDTLNVNLDRVAHYTAKAVDHAGYHYLKKRSAGFLAAPAVSHVARVDYPIARVVAAPVVPAAPWGVHAAPWGVRAPIAPLAVGHAAAFGVRPAPLGHIW